MPGASPGPNRRGHGHRLRRCIDDGTPESTRTFFPHVTLLENDSDPGYAAATTRGVAAGSGDVILLLNNDAFCQPDFLEHLVASFESDERVGAVAPLTIQEDERTSTASASRWM